MLQRLFIVGMSALLSVFAPMAEGQPAATFDIFEYEVVGNTVLPSAQIERAVMPFLGPNRTIEDVEKARGALEQAYRAGGYPTVLVDIPEQKVDEGVVRLSVVEGRVGRLRVTGARYYSQGRIVAAVPALAEGEVLYAPDVQDQLGNVNRSANRRVQPVLKPGRVPGTTDVELAVEDKSPLTARLDLNNSNSPNTEPLRLAGILRYDNLFQRDHSVTLGYQMSPQDTSQVKVWSLAYFVPSKDGSWYLTAYGIKSDSNVPAGVSATTVLGKGWIAGLRLALPAPGSDRLTQSFTVGIDRKDQQENLLQGGGLALQTPITYTPLLLAYNLSYADDWGGLNQLTSGIGFSVRGLGNNAEEFENKRFKAQSNYVVWRVDASRLQKLPGDAALFARIDGQLANQPLVSGEQYAAGGLENVRGYLVATALGDNAIHWSIELRSPSFAQKVGEWLKEARAVAFYEGAHLELIDPLPRQTAAYNLAGTGVGLRVRAGNAVSAQVDVGYPLRTAPYTPAGDTRVQFSLSAEF